jgi:hypothetical protein
MTFAFLSAALPVWSLCGFLQEIAIIIAIADEGIVFSNLRIQDIRIS